MKASIITAIALIMAMLLAPVSITYAQWNAINSGYGITTNWHGKDVPLGESVTAWAGTTDSSITEIRFRWKRPDESIFAEVSVSLLPSDYFITPSYPTDAPQEIKDWAIANPGITVYYATDTQNPDTLGDWCVKAYFIGLDGKRKEQVEDAIAIRATSFNTIPDLPVVGVAGALAVMLLSLHFYTKKKMIKLK